MENNGAMYGQDSREARTGEKRGFKVSTAMWVVGGVLVVLGLINAVLILRPSSFGAQSQTAVHVFPSGHPPVITSYDLVEEGSVTMSLRQPFYTPTALDSLRQGDILYIEVTGHGLWRQVPDPKATAFHRTFRVVPDGPESIVNPDGKEVAIPQGRVNSPEDLPAGYRRKEFPHQTVQMGALVAAVGTVAYDDDGMAERLDEHFIVGTKRWLRIDGQVLKDTQVLFTLNLRWKEVSWQSNSGTFQIITRVYRPRAAS